MPNELRSRLAVWRGWLANLLSNHQPPDTTPPSVTLTASQSAFTAPGTLTLTATPAGIVARVEFYRAGVKIGESFGPTFTLDIPVSGPAQAGAYTAKAVKLSGAAASSNPQSITVDIVITPPTVSLALSAASFTQADTLTLTATAASERGVKQVAYYWGTAETGTLIGTATTAPYAVTRAITPADNGAPRTVTAVVTDNGGQTAQDSETVTVNIAPEVQAPTLTLDKASALTGATITATLTRLQAGDTLDWGDGTTVPASGTLTHAYSASGPYTVSVMRGGVAAATASLTISTPVIGITYDPPVTISAGGTYSGNWHSDSPSIPAVTITTSAPVTIHNGNVRGLGDLIRCRQGAGQVTIRNMGGIGLNPNINGRSQGRFADLQFLASALVENCEIEGTGGIYLNGYGGTGAQTFIVRRNFARNLNGRFSNGAGGYQTGAGNFYRIQLVQFNHVNGIPGARIEWNRTLNEPRLSHVEDTINLSDSSGASDSDRIIVRRNLLEGAYSWNPADVYSGGGIILGDGGGQYQTAEENTVLETSNYGIAVADGNDMSILNNTILGRGRLDDGTLLDADSDAGIYLRDYKPSTVRRPESVIASGNTVGWGTPTSGNPNNRWDISVDTAGGVPVGTATGNTFLPAGPITQASLDAARQAWLDSVVAASLTIGRTS